MLTTFLQMPRAAYLLLAATLGALAFALIMQYGFDVQPCVLCLWQRVPFIIVALLAVVALLRQSHPEQIRLLLAACAVVCAVGVGLALFHTGVELHWWLGTSGCKVQPLSGASVDDLRTQLMHTVVASCDQISWTFLGFSMANWNVPFSAALAVFSGIAAWRVKS